MRRQKSRCLHLGIPVNLAEDFASDTLTRALELLRNHRAGKLSRNWLFRVAHNVMVDWLRHDRVEPRTSRGDLMEGVVDRKAKVGGTTAILEYFSPAAAEGL